MTCQWVEIFRPRMNAHVIKVKLVESVRNEKKTEN
jgi:hypothetical protein